MVEQQVEARLQKADRWSKIIALLFAIGFYALATLLTKNVHFNASVAAFAGIGIRIYVPYHASTRGAGKDQVPSQALPETGSYHHGAVGGGLILGSVGALIVMWATADYYAALVGGLAVGASTYIVLQERLPGE